MDEYRLLNKKFQKQKTNPYKKIITSILNKVLISAILFLVALIMTKNKTYKDEIYKYVYGYNLSFQEIENLYKKYLGFIVPNSQKKEGTSPVSSEKLTYDSLTEIEGGVKLKVGKMNPINAIESGLVVFVGEKENLGKTLIIEQTDGVEAWYVGVDIPELKIYDYVEKNAIIGNSEEENISIYFKKKGESIDYKDYLS